jgi:hypothetical protein
MGPVHEMLPEDEIILCGVVLALGLVLGMATRFLVAFLRERRSA